MDAHENSRPSPRLTVAALVASSALAAGCTISFNQPAGSGSGGPSCAAMTPTMVGVPDHEHRTMLGDGGVLQFSRDATSPVPAQVAGLVCADETAASIPAIEKERMAAIADDLRKLDDRHIDSLRAAMMVVDCAKHPQAWPGVMGLVAWYAEHIELDAVARSLSEAGVSDEMAARFGETLKQARAKLAQRLAEVGARERQVWVDTPIKVHEDRQSYVTEHAGAYAELDTLLEAGRHARSSRKVPASSIADLVALRDRYFQACRGEDCTSDPFVVELTAELVVLHVVAGDPLRAAAEDQLFRGHFRNPRVDRAFTHAAVVTAEAETLTVEQNAWKKYEAARAQGADPAALVATFGDPPPIEVNASAYVSDWKPAELPNYAAGVATDAFESAGGVLARKVVKGADAELVFADDVMEYLQSNCVETGRIDYLRADGKIVYRKKCGPAQRKVSRRKVPPVTVPAEEAAGLKAGETVVALVGKSDRRGVVLYALRENEDGKTWLQFRSHRLTP